jgi:glycosyltransferase involved in cell wall biosynthesis
LVATLAPGFLLPVAQFLGVTLASNLIFAGMILFLCFQLIAESAVSTIQGRKLREVITSLAAKDFLSRYRSRSDRPKVVVVFPCYNESANLPLLINQIRETLLSVPVDIEWVPVIVNDGSTDQSETLLKKLSKEDVIFTSHLSNAGVSAALLTGYKIAAELGAKFVVQCDSDGQHPISEIPRMVSLAEEKTCDLLVGSRYLDLRGLAAHESSTRLRRVGSQCIRVALKLFSSRSTVSDPTSGFRVYSNSAIQILKVDMPDEYPEPEAIALLFSKGLRVEETPISMQKRQGGESSISGLKSAQFMIKVVSALLGLRLRTFFREN